MTITRNGRKIYQFQARHGTGKLVCANVFSNAIKSAVKRFLFDLIEKTLFIIKFIRVNGGSEFTGEFSSLAPRSISNSLSCRPHDQNTIAALSASTALFKEEFYYCYDFTVDTIAEIRLEIEKTIDKYNTFRPHKNLGGLTPMQYVQNIEAESYSV